MPTELPAGTHMRRLTSAGTFWLAGVHYMVGGPHGFQQLLVITAGDKITVADLEGAILIEHAQPAPGVKYVGNGRHPGRNPRPRNRHRSPDTELSPMS